MTSAPIFVWDSKPRRTGPTTIRVTGNRRLDLIDIDGQVRTCGPGDVIEVDGAALEFLEQPDFQILDEPTP